MTSVVRGMTERRQHRWFLTCRAVDLLYVTDHQHPAPREEARATGLAAFHPEGELPKDYRERFALDHDHPVHLEDQGNSPFAAGGDSADGNGGDGGPDHEHPPWTATSRGVETSLRRLAMLEPVYRLAPDLLRSGRVNLPATDAAASREVRMTDFRLLRHGGFYHAVARYGPDLWTPFTYAGLHATERSLRRKEQHHFWGVDCYSHEEDRYLRIGNRVFYEDPDQEVEPLGPDRGGPRRLGQGAGPQHSVRRHAHAVLHPRRAVQPGGGPASLPGPGVQPVGASHRGPAHRHAVFPQPTGVPMPAADGRGDLGRLPAAASGWGLLRRLAVAVDGRGLLRHLPVAAGGRVGLGRLPADAGRRGLLGRLSAAAPHHERWQPMRSPAEAR